MDNKAIKYAKDVLAGKWQTGLYIKKLCQKFLDDLEKQEREDFEYFFDTKIEKKINLLMKLINFGTGSVANKSTFDACVDYQFFLIFNIFCWVRKDNQVKRRYEKVILHIARKNSKTVNNALIMIILMLLESPYSQFYLCANIREQAKLLYKDMEIIIKSSPHLLKHFKIRRDYIECTVTNSIVRPLSSDYNTADGLRVSAAVIDEVGSAKDSGMIDAMTGGMLSVENRLLVMISTSYPNLTNPFLEYCEYSQKVLDGIIEDENIFPMLYTLDIGDELTPDNLIKANPLQATLEEGMKFLEKTYKDALEMGKLTNFYCKHLNKWLAGSIEEAYIDMDKLRGCEDKEGFDWTGKKVYLGLDLSLTTDLTAFSMVHYERETGKIYAKSWGFLPNNAVDRKSRKERIDYRNFIKNGDCFACGDDVIDYGFIEDFILSIKEKCKVQIVKLGFDKYNAMSTINKLQNGGIHCVEIPQHSRFLNSPIKLLEEKILNNLFSYDKNKLLEYNFSNCRVHYDTNMRKYLHKKRSNHQMIDMVMSIVFALKLLEEEELNKISLKVFAF